MKRFYCNSCGLRFSSAFEMAEHFRSKEHKDKAGGENLDFLIKKFITGVRTAIKPDEVEEEQK